MNITKKLIHSHLLKGEMVVGQEIAGARIHQAGLSTG